MEQDIRDLDEVIFGILSEKDIRDIAVCQIDNPKLGDKNGGYGTVYDPRLGPIENGKLCEICQGDIWSCAGHYGFIELNECIIHPLFYKRVVDFLRCICIKCNNLLITEDQIKLNNLTKLKSTKRFDKILEKLEKIDMCPVCSQPQPDIKYTTTDNNISMVYKQKDKGKISIVIPVDDIKKTFENITDDHVRLLGFNPELVHPKSLIMTVFPVIPYCCRPLVLADGQTCDDDLTIQIVEIIKANNHLKSEEDVPISDTKRQKYLQTLKFRIATFFNNCLDPETPILLWNGNIKKAKDIIIGDELIGDDGDKRTVLNTCDGEDEMFEIEQYKGDNYTVNSNHILTLKFSGHKNIFWVKPNNNSPLGSYWMKWYDNSLKKIKNKTVSVTKKRTKDEAFEYIQNFKKNINIPDTFDISVKEYLKLPKSTTSFFMGFKLENPINWETKDVMLDPYILGMWLGDGNSNGKGFTSEDVELINKWKNWGLLNNAEVVLHPQKIAEYNKSTNYTYHEYQISDPKKYRPDINYGIKSKFNIGYNRTYPSPLKNLLKKYNLIDNKHIPDDYIYNDEQTRLNLLAGIIDTDGYVYNEGTSIEISQSIIRETLVNQIHFIAKSLGFYSTIKEKTTTKNGKISKQLRVYISGYGIEKIPTILKRKKCSNPRERDTLRTGININSVGTGKYNGFTVDKNNRFLLGDFTVTHNSGGRAKHTTSGRPIKGLKERITGKEGLIRSNIMGKRCEFTGRTVIGPDPTLKMGQLGIPREVANNLTVPVQVTNYNYDYLNNLVNDGKVNIVKTKNGEKINIHHHIFNRGTRLNHGDIVIRKDPKTGEEIELVIDNGKEVLKPGDKLKRNGEFVKGIKYPEKRKYHLNIGDICERVLHNGDIVLLNRQPTKPIKLRSEQMTA
jgi:hypothetical protein